MWWRLLARKPLSSVDVTYFYSSTLWYNLSLHLASGNGPVIFQVCWQRLPKVNICCFPEQTMPFNFRLLHAMLFQIQFHRRLVVLHGSASDSNSTIFRILHHSGRCEDSCWYSFLESHRDVDFSKIFKNKPHRCFLWVNWRISYKKNMYNSASVPTSSKMETGFSLFWSIYFHLVVLLFFHKTKK